jgi:hypothetical protein
VKEFVFVKNMVFDIISQNRVFIEKFKCYKHTLELVFKDIHIRNDVTRLLTLIKDQNCSEIGFEYKIGLRMINTESYVDLALPFRSSHIYTTDFFINHIDNLLQSGRVILEDKTPITLQFTVLKRALQ